MVETRQAQDCDKQHTWETWHNWTMWNPSGKEPRNRTATWHSRLQLFLQQLIVSICWNSNLLQRKTTSGRDKTAMPNRNKTQIHRGQDRKHDCLGSLRSSKQLKWKVARGILRRLDQRNMSNQAQIPKTPICPDRRPERTHKRMVLRRDEWEREDDRTRREKIWTRNSKLKRTNLL